MNALLDGWRCDPVVVAAALSAIAVYAIGVRNYVRRRSRRWPVTRIVAFVAGIASGIIAIESPLDAAGDVRFAPHMIQHLILTDGTAPLVLLGGPLLLALGATSPAIARRIVTALRSRAAHAVAFPVVTWAVFIVTLWAIHFTGFFEAALDHEPLHLLEHALYVGTALLFWLPVIAIGPTPWVDGPLAFPLRMLYVLIAMPAEAFLGFSIYGAKHILYPHYAVAGLGDQTAAGEIMWIGSGLVMFVAFMIVGFEWSRHEQRLGERSNARLESAH